MAVAPLKLNRLPSGTVRPDLLQLYWQQAMEAIERSFAELGGAVAAIEAAQDAADAANTAAGAAQVAADAAQTAADTANTVAETVTATSALATSYVDNASPLTATDAGASATITVLAHNRIYGDGTSVAVAGGSVTGLAYSTDYWVSYIDAARTGGTVTYLASTTAQGNGSGNSDRHFVGAVRTPAALGGPIGGNGTRPPGYVEP